MKFLIKKEVLLEKLQRISGPTSSKQNFPILNSVLISTQENKLKFITTDLDTTIISFQEAKIEEKGEVAVLMKRLLSIVRELPSSELIVQSNKNNLLIKCEKIEFKMSILDAKEFPPIEEKTKTSLIKLDPQDLEEMINLTSFCVGEEDVNYVLNGILFEVFKDKISLVSTDGKRLSYITKNLPSTQSDIEEKISFILPLKAVNELLRLLKNEEEVFLFTEQNKIGFDFKHTQFISRPIEGEFPNYSQYIPPEGENKLKIKRRDFLSALRRANLLSTPDYQGVKLELKKNHLLISKITPQVGEEKEIVDANYEGPSLEIGFNPTYLIDVLKNLEDEEVSFEFFGQDKPAVLRKENYIYLVLPMKI
jgi:DNA polymerase-3 subunit beta